MTRLIWGVWIALILVLGHEATAPQARAQDAEPVFCPYTEGVYFRANLFPRYEPQNRRLVLTDWTTGENVQEVSSNLDFTVPLEWSLDCRYLAVAVGPSSSMDTVVYDTVTNENMGVVPDAHGQPHHVTWGPGDYLIVETRSGAVLWNIPAHTQHPLTSLFDPVSVRNFSRIRWDPERNHILVSFAVGGEAAYDLLTGQEVLSGLPTAPDAGQVPNASEVGGQTFVCGTTRSYRSDGPVLYTTLEQNDLAGIQAYYDIVSRQIILGHTKRIDLFSQERRPTDVLQVVEQVDIPWFRFRGWSDDCRFFAGSLGIPGSSDNETVVWDVTTNARVLTIRAVGLLQQLTWGPGDLVLIQTRDGAQLWHLATATRLLLHSYAELTPDGSTVRNFSSVLWDAGRGQLLGVPVSPGNAVVAYDLNTGQAVGVYPSGGDRASVAFELSPDGGLMAVYHAQEGVMSVWYRNSGAGVQLNLGPNAADLHDQVIPGPYSYNLYRSSVAISPDNRFVAVDRYNLLVWDLTALTPDRTPNFVYPALGLKDIVFEDNFTVRSRSDTLQGVNVATGEGIAYVEERAIRTTTPVEGQNGGGSNYHWWGYWNVGCDGRYARYDAEQRRLEIVTYGPLRMVHVLESDLNYMNPLEMSHNCAIVTGVVSSVDNTDVPYDRARCCDGGTFVAWDANSGDRILELPNPPDSKTLARVFWSPDLRWALIQTTAGYYLWQPDSGHLVMLQYMVTPGDAINTELQTYWDFSRGQVLVSGWHSVFAFDLFTGRERFRFGECDSFWGCSFRVSEDQTILTVRDNGNISGRWNLDTLTCAPGPTRRSYWTCE